MVAACFAKLNALVLTLEKLPIAKRCRLAVVGAAFIEQIPHRSPEDAAKILMAFNKKWTEVVRTAKIAAE